MRRAARTDANETPIVDALRRLGCTIERIRSLRGGCPDLLVGKDGRNFLCEIKVPKTGRLSEAQKAWRDEWKGSKPFVLKTVDDVIAFVRLIGG